MIGPTERGSFALHPMTQKDEEDDLENAIKMSLGIYPQDAEGSFGETEANTNIPRKADEAADDPIIRGLRAARTIDAIEARLEVDELALGMQMSQLDLRAMENETAADSDMLAYLEAEKAKAKEQRQRSIDVVLAGVKASNAQFAEEKKQKQLEFMKMLLGEDYVLANTSESNIQRAAQALVEGLQREDITHELKVFFASNFEAMKPTLINPANGDSRLHTLVRHFNHGNPFAFFVLAELLRHGVDKMHKNNDGFTPINAASETNHELLEALFSLTSFEKEDLSALAVGFERVDLKMIIWREY